jgi:SAM-dependent methyltransferase
MVRDFWRRPRSIAGRLSSVNFHNNRICSKLVMGCCVCGQRGAMHYDFPDVRLRKAHGIGLLRETLCCRHCGASMRDRQMAYGLLQVVAKLTGQTVSSLHAFRQSRERELRILDTDSFGAVSRALRGLPGYVHSQFKPDLAKGQQLPDGSINVNLLDMPFDAGNFDIIMTSDVMEHVAEDDLAHREIYRCLSPNGTYVFTVPYDPSLLCTRQLTQVTGIPDVRFVLERHIHGDPHSTSGIVAHRIYGQQLVDDLSRIGYEVRFECIESPTQGIFGGDLFLARKRS